MNKTLRLGLIFCLVIIYSGLVGSAKAAQWLQLSVALFDKAHTLSQAQLQFTAENYDAVIIGQWDADIEKASVLKSYNPEMSILGYINSKHLITGSPRYQECADNEEIFAHDFRGNRIKSLDFGQILTDIHNSDWTVKIIQWTNRLPPAFDGIFLDVAQPTLVESNYRYLPKGYNPSQHAIAMKELFWNVKHNTQGMVVFNGLKVGLKYDGYTDNVDGGVVEGFIFSRSCQDANFERVSNHVNALIETGKRGIIGAVSVKGYKQNINSRIFALACYLLGANELSIYNFVDINSEFSNPLQYYPEYKIALGSPVNYPNKMEDLLDPVTNLAIRHFEEGMVIVNPWPNDIDIQLDGEYRKLIPYGGGVVGSDGTYDGSLGNEDLHGLVTVPGKSAIILINAAVQPAQPEGLVIIIDNGDQ